MTIKPQLHDRLTNWGVYVRVVTKQDISATGRFCETLAVRAGKGVWQTTEAKRVVDELDGDVVEKAMRGCSQSTKELLKLLYVFNGKPDWICRRLKIPHRPKSIFDLKRYHAETEIERRLFDADAKTVARRTIHQPRNSAV